jgi:hypothetical protein
MPQRRGSRHPLRMLENMKSLGLTEDRRKCIVDPLPLMIRYLDASAELSDDDREILLFALYIESLKNNGLADQAITEMKKAARGTAWLRT